MLHNNVCLFGPWPYLLHGPPALVNISPQGQRYRYVVGLMMESSWMLLLPSCLVWARERQLDAHLS